MKPVIISSYPTSRNFSVRITMESDASLFPFVVETLFPADEVSTKWRRRGLFAYKEDAEPFARYLQNA